MSPLYLLLPRVTPFISCCLVSPPPTSVLLTYAPSLFPAAQRSLPTTHAEYWYAYVPQRYTTPGCVTRSHPVIKTRDNTRQRTSSWSYLGSRQINIDDEPRPRVRHGAHFTSINEMGSSRCRCAAVHRKCAGTTLFVVRGGKDALQIYGWGSI